MHQPSAGVDRRGLAGGFYAPGVVVGDVRRHGIAVLGPDLARSAYDCTLERAAGDDLAVRLALRYVRGLAEVTGTALVAGCVRIGTTLATRERAGRREAHATDHQAAGISAMTSAQRSWNRRRRSASETGSPERAWARKY